MFSVCCKQNRSESGSTDKMNSSKGMSKSINGPNTGGEVNENHDPSADRLEGLLNKYTNVMKGWQYRWFVVDREQGVLEYYMPDDKKKDQPRGRILLARCIVAPSEEDSQTFTVSAFNGNVYKLRASDVRQRQLWVDRLRQAAQQQDTKATLVAHHNDCLNDVRESLRIAQKTQTKLALAIEGFTHSDQQLLLIKATSHASILALEESFVILQSINQSHAFSASA